jgi:hypothetical protein
MRRTLLRKSCQKRLVLVATVFLCFSITGFCQSLGDVAREQRQKQQQKNAKPDQQKKVITNEDLPAHESDDPIEEDSRTDLVHDESAFDSSSESKVQQGERWKAQIQAQKTTISNLQAQMDKLNSSIHYVESNRYYNGVQHNERQAQKQEQVEQMRKQLEEQRQKLEEMQEAARRAGFGSAVYDP